MRWAGGVGPAGGRACSARVWQEGEAALLHAAASNVHRAALPGTHTFPCPPPAHRLIVGLCAPQFWHRPPVGCLRKKSPIVSIMASSVCAVMHSGLRGPMPAGGGDAGCGGGLDVGGLRGAATCGSGRSQAAARPLSTARQPTQPARTPGRAARAGPDALADVVRKLRGGAAPQVLHPRLHRIIDHVAAWCCWRGVRVRGEVRGEGGRWGRGEAEKGGGQDKWLGRGPRRRSRASLADWPSPLRRAQAPAPPSPPPGPRPPRRTRFLGRRGGAHHQV